MTDPEAVDAGVADAGASPNLIPFFDEANIPAGSFVRAGSTVTITRDMAMMTTEVTQGLWTEISGGTNPSYFPDCDGLGGDECPVEEVNWFSAVGFANALTAARNAADGTNLTPCYVISGCDADDWQDGAALRCSVSFANPSDPLSCTGYRLPTEAEWEYAYRAGSSTAYYPAEGYTGEDDSALGDIAWFDGNADGMPHPVGQKLPNAWGLFDMAGNVCEWTWDWYGPYPGVIVISDYIGPESGAVRVNRGGSWAAYSGLARAAERAVLPPYIAGLYGGFRLTRTLP